MVICHPYAGTFKKATPDDKEMNEVEKRLRGRTFKTVMLKIHGVPSRHAVNCPPLLIIHGVPLRHAVNSTSLLRIYGVTARHAVNCPPLLIIHGVALRHAVNSPSLLRIHDATLRHAVNCKHSVFYLSYSLLSASIGSSREALRAG